MRLLAIIALLLVGAPSHARAQVASGLTFTSTGLNISPSIASAYQGVAYASALFITGGQSPYSCVVSAGFLPAGITLTGSTCILGGTPTATSAATFSITATESGPLHQTNTRAFTITPASLSSIAVTLSLTSITNSGTSQATAMCTWSNTVVNGANGCPVVFASSATSVATINSASGLITGAASGTGSTNISASFNSVTSPNVALTLTANVPQVGTTTIPPSQINIPYPAFQLNASGGTVTTGYTWSVTVGALPTGLVLSSGGLISGTATGTTTTPTIQVCDNAGMPNCSTFTPTVTVATVVSLTINPPAPTISVGQSLPMSAVVTYTAGPNQTLTNGSGFLSEGTAQGSDKSGIAHSTTTTAVGSGNVTGSGPKVVDAGDTLVVACGTTDNTPTILAPTDTGGDTFTSVVGPAINLNQPLRLQLFKSDNVAASAADIFSCPLSTTTTGDTDVMVWEVDNTANPSPDQSSIGTDPAASMAITSTAITPTTPNTVELVAGWIAGTSRIFCGTSGPCTGCSFLVQDSIGRGALMSCSIAGTTSSAFSMQFNVSNRDWDVAAVNLKPAPGGTGLVWSATDLSGSNVATISSSGIAFGADPGTSTIKAAIGAVNNTTTLTVNGTTGGMVFVNPSSAQTPVGGTVNFKACQVTGVGPQCGSGTGSGLGGDITTSATWTSDNTGIATVNSSGAAKGITPGVAHIQAAH